MNIKLPSFLSLGKIKSALGKIKENSIVKKAEEAAKKSKVNVKSEAEKIVKKGMVKSTEKKVEGFYSKKNLAKVEKLLQADREYVSSHSEMSTAPLATRRLSQASKSLTGAPASELLALHFFSIYKEVKTQEQLLAKFPEYILVHKGAKEKFNSLLSEVNSVKKTVSEAFARKGSIGYFNQKISDIDAEVGVILQAYTFVK
jgi:hypothetical protein